MKKMSTYVKNIILTHPVLSIIILLIIPIFVYLIALIIDVSYDIPLDTVLSWESSLNYFGTVYGSLLGFLGVIITILYTQNQVTKQKKESDLIRVNDNAISVMPYMHMEFIGSTNFVSSKHYDLELNASEGKNADQIIYMDYKVTNKGKGAATELYLFTTNDSDKEFNQLISCDQSHINFIDMSEEKELRIKINYSPKDNDEYPFLKIRFEYKDMFFNNYKENHEFYFKIKNNWIENNFTSLRSKHVFDPKGNRLQIGIDSTDRVPIV